MPNIVTLEAEAKVSPEAFLNMMVERDVTTITPQQHRLLIWLSVEEGLAKMPLPLQAETRHSLYEKFTEFSRRIDWENLTVLPEEFDDNADATDEAIADGYTEGCEKQ